MEKFFNKPSIYCGEKVKYRYVRYGEQTLYEFTAKNEPLQYRLYFVNGPGLVEDVISAWQDQPYLGSYGDSAANWWKNQHNCLFQMFQFLRQECEPYQPRMGRSSWKDYHRAYVMWLFQVLTVLLKPFNREH